MVPCPPLLGPFLYTPVEGSLAEVWCLQESSQHDEHCRQVSLGFWATLAADFVALVALFRFVRSQPHIGTVTPLQPLGGSWHLRTHDNVNMVILPTMMVLAMLATLALVPQVTTNVALAVYMVVDFSWIVARPQAVRSKPLLILTHHIVTYNLAFGSMAINVDYAYVCSWSTLVEFNTFFLVAMQSARGTKLGYVLEVLFWITAILFRLILHPWLVWHLMLILPMMHPVERTMAVLHQLFLVCFNIYYVYLRMRKDRAKELAARAAAKRAAGASQPLINGS